MPTAQAHTTKRHTNMASGKWIGAFLGFIAGGGPLGALAGYALGWLFDKGLDSVNTDSAAQFADTSASYGRQRAQEGQRNSFLFSLLVLASYIIKADGRVMHSEMEMVRQFLRRNFGEVAVQEGERIILNLFEQQKRMGAASFRNTIYDACRQIAQNMEYAQRLQLLNFLVMIAQADGRVVAEEVQALKEVARYMGLSEQDVDSMLNLRDGATNLDAAYAVLGISPDASDDEVKKAYRAMALKHHPDRVATLGDDVRKAAEKKFQEINNAKEAIYKARGL